MATCYRHPSRETGVSCSNCGNPICPDCMTPTSVGMRCPDCAKQKTKVRTAATITRGADEPRVTVAIIVVCVLIFLSEGNIGSSGASGRIYQNLALFGPYVHDGDYWRLITGGFLHSGIFHIGFNMYLLWVIGQQLERAIGSVRFGVLYFTALLFGSFGALVQTTEVGIVGASGAVFGLFGVLAVEQHRRGYAPFSGGLGGLILINLAIGFLPGLHIAFGGHIGGLIGGLVAGYAFVQADRLRQPWMGYAACAVLCVVAVAGSIIASNSLHDFSL
jgi:membrane associated rhomboid family serine protease